MTARRIKVGVIAALLSLGAVACSSSTAAERSLSAKTKAGAAADSASQLGRGSITRNTPGAVPPTAPTSSPGGSVQGGPPEVPPPFPPDPSLRVTVSLTPACAKVGQVIKLVVRTEAKATVAYQAIYSDGKSGAGHGYGAGYGGNDGGTADLSGIYTSTWKTASNTPAGPGRVDVYVFARGTTNTTSTRFSIAGPSGVC